MSMYFDGKRVSNEWYAILTAARRAGVSFHVNQGQRTIADQWRFWNYYRAHGWPIAAYPSQSAPHIKYGQANHALDINQTDGGVYRLASWLRGHGAAVYWTVRGEPWHIECSLADVRRLAQRFDDPLAFMRPDEARWVREYVRLKSHNHNLKRRRYLRKLMSARRREISRAARGHLKGATPGWTVLERRRRYAVLYRYSHS